MTMTVQEYRANARQCVSWAESARDSENRDAFFDLAATWVSAAARIEHAARDREIDRRDGDQGNPRTSLRRAAAG
jgi:hypothetical protein